DDPDAPQKIEATLTRERVEALRQSDWAEQNRSEDPQELREALPRLREEREGERFRQLLPGYVCRFIENSAPLIGLRAEGDIRQETDGIFRIQAWQKQALAPLELLLESYPDPLRERLTVYRPEVPGDTVFLHPGELLFDRYQALVSTRLGEEARRGTLLVDPA